MELEDLKIDRSRGRRRSSKRRRSPWFSRGLILLTLGVCAWIFWAPIQRFVDGVRLPRVEALLVRATDPAAVGAIEGTAANGYVVAGRRAALSADTPGRIVEMRVAEGSVVRAGDLVAKLYPDEYAAAVERAEADLEAARAETLRAAAQIESARSSAELAQRNAEAAAADANGAKAAETFAAARYRREQELLADGFASEDSLQARRERADRTHAERVAAEARVRAADASVADANHRVTVAEAASKGTVATVAIRQAAVTQARATLSKTDVRAPFDGVVVLKDAEVGEVVSPNSQGGSNARGSVCTLVDFNSLEVQADVQETTIANVAVDMLATIFLDAYPSVPYRGKVTRVWPTADRQKGTIEVRVSFDQLDDRLRPDMGVRVVFAASDASQTEEEPTREPEIVIPTSSVVTEGAENGVFVIERGKVRFAPVTLGARRGQRVVIAAGLEVGTRIVRTPSPELADGDRIQIEG